MPGIRVAKTWAALNRYIESFSSYTLARSHERACLAFAVDVSIFSLFYRRDEGKMCDEEERCTPRCISRYAGGYCDPKWIIEEMLFISVEAARLLVLQLTFPERHIPSLSSILEALVHELGFPLLCWPDVY